MTGITTEKEVEKYLRKNVKLCKGIAYKFISPGNAGVPDRLVLLPDGRIYFVELKRPGGKTTKLQDRQIKILRALGFDVRVIDSIQKVEEFISEIQTT